jgi:hypothetical protein
MEIEAEQLLSSLSSQRDHVLSILSGLEEDALRRPVLPTGWSCLGLVRHLTFDVERFWFGQVVGGEPPDEFDAHPGLAWTVPDDITADVVFDDYRREIAAATAIIAATALDTAPAGWPDEVWPDWRMPDLRTVMLHVITETACHAGHLDAVRELLDGRTWLIL